MRLVRWVVNSLAAVVIAGVFLYFVISLCIVFFKATGLLTSGPMLFDDMDVPSYASLLLFQAVSLALMGTCLLVRGTFGQKDDFPFLRRKGGNGMRDWHLGYPSEYLRPWKLATLALGIALLVLGSYTCPAPDWDIPISFIMALLAYLTAPWAMRILLERRWRLLPLMLFFAWFTVDGCYTLYWCYRDPAALIMRKANFPASLSLYAMCGVVWLYRGSLGQLLSEIRHSLSRRGRK